MEKKWTIKNLKLSYCPDVMWWNDPLSPGCCPLSSLWSRLWPVWTTWAASWEKKSQHCVWDQWPWKQCKEMRRALRPQLWPDPLIYWPPSYAPPSLLLLPYRKSRDSERKQWVAFCLSPDCTSKASPLQFVTVSKHSAASFCLHLPPPLVSKVWSTPSVDSLGALHAGVWSECCLLCKRHHVQHLALLWGFLLGGPRSLPLRAQ